jgi:hypothetical protein
MLQYMPNKEAAFEAIDEMKRVARKSVFIGDFRTECHQHKKDKHVLPSGERDLTIQHTLFQRSEIENKDFETFDGWWGGETRFNALYIVNYISNYYH